MAEPYSSSGSALYISATTPATLDATGYAAATYLPVGNLISLGDELGRVYSGVDVDFLSARQTQTIKGQFTEGKITATMARNPTDAGQALIMTALNSDALYTFKVTHGDGTTTPTIQYWRGLVMSYKTTGLSANNVTGAEVGITTNTPIIEVAAT